MKTKTDNKTDDMKPMGKPPKSRKHKKIKASAHYDPETFTKKKEKKEHNLAPSASEKEDQHIPRSVRELMKLKQTGGVNSAVTKKRKKKKKPDAAVAVVAEKGQTRPVPAPVKFKQGQNESDFHFRRRMEMQCNNMLQKSKLEKEWKLPIDSIDDEGNIIVTKKKTKAASAKAKVRLQKLAERKGKSKSKESETVPEFATDKVEFGEVVMAPPSLTSKPRKSQTPSSDKFKRSHSGLLLSNMLEPKSDALSDKTAVTGAAASQRGVGKTVPRKQLTPLQQMQHDKARDDAVQRYRALKEAKLASKQP